MSLTNYAETALLNHLLGKTAYTMPTTVYAALFTADPGEAGSLSNEVASGVGYARQAITSNMSASTGGSTSANTAAITFGPNTTTNWGTITHCALIDGGSLGSGNVLLKGALAASKAISVGDSFAFNIGALTAALL